MPRIGIVNAPAEELTVERLKELFPKKKESITPEIVNIINEANNNPFFSNDEFLDTIITYKDIMEKNKSSLKDYLCAIKFCAYLESEDYNLTEAYKKSHAHTDFVKERLNAPSNSPKYRELTNAASRYRKRPLVVQILTQSQLGLYLMFQGETFKAINVLSDIMTHGKSEMARVAAAKELLANVKAPETTKVEIDVGIKQSDAMNALNAQLAEFALNGLQQLRAGNVDLKVLGSMKVNNEEDTIDVEDI